MRSLSFAGIGVILVVIVALLVGWPSYNVYAARKHGEAELAVLDGDRSGEDQQHAGNHGQQADDIPARLPGRKPQRIQPQKRPTNTRGVRWSRESGSRWPNGIGTT